MNFVIYAPGDYTPNGGGCVALHRLCHNICLVGEKGFIMTSKKNPDYKGTQVTQDEAVELCKDGQGIAIYPEVTCGNPFSASKVMRWILYNVRTYGEYGIFGENDLIYTYAPFFKLREDRPIDGQLRANELNLDIFKKTNHGDRYGACYLVKKENSKEGIHPDGSIQLDDYPSKGGNEYLAKIFNECEIFYSYDSATWLSVMCTLCGCLSIVVPNEGVSPEEWHEGFPYFKYGIAYGLNDIEYALLTRHKVINELRNIEKMTFVEVRKFIKRAYEL